jgi:hypothetical protein
MVMSAGPPTPTPSSVSGVKSLNCPNCGAALTVRTFQNAVTVVCSHCNSILDAKDPNLQILQKFQVNRGEDQPLIPLGTRGTIRGVQYEVVGFERRTIYVDGVPYSWHEYLLFNPYRGFRYLTEYNGHWNDVSVVKSLPTLNDTSPPSVTYLGERFRHFQTAQASTSFVLGEFPWQVRVGETATVTDYVHPPRVLSSEGVQHEVTWSMGEYMSGRDVWKAFGVPGDPPQSIGVYENQPSPLASNVISIWSMFGIFLVSLLVIAMLVSTFAQQKVVFDKTYHFTPSRTAEPSFVTEPFELPGRTSDVEVHTTANVGNSWIYLNYALINLDSGEAYDFGREISYYHGYDSDGSWSEGGTSDRVIVPSVPAGKYYLRIEPESQAGSVRTTAYQVTVTRDVPVNALYLYAILALLIPAAAITWRSISFEHRRWAESEYAPSGDD